MQKSAKGRKTKGRPMAAEREALDFCERPGFKTHKALSLRPNPNRKFVTNLANTHAQLRRVAHHPEKTKAAHGGGGQCGINGACLEDAPNAQNASWVPGSSTPSTGPGHMELLWAPKPAPDSSSHSVHLPRFGIRDSEHSEQRSGPWVT